MKLFLVVLLIALAVSGCKTTVQQACDGHGHSTGYANGLTKCSDGTWQS